MTLLRVVGSKIHPSKRPVTLSSRAIMLLYKPNLMRRSLTSPDAEVSLTGLTKTTQAPSAILEFGEKASQANREGLYSSTPVRGLA